MEPNCIRDGLSVFISRIWVAVWHFASKVLGSFPWMWLRYITFDYCTHAGIDNSRLTFKDRQNHATWQITEITAATSVHEFSFENAFSLTCVLINIKYEYFIEHFTIVWSNR